MPCIDAGAFTIDISSKNIQHKFPPGRLNKQKEKSDIRIVKGRPTLAPRSANQVKDKNVGWLDVI